MRSLPNQMRSTMILLCLISNRVVTVLTGWYQSQEMIRYLRKITTSLKKSKKKTPVASREPRVRRYWSHHCAAILLSIERRTRREQCVMATWELKSVLWASHPSENTVHDIKQPCPSQCNLEVRGTVLPLFVIVVVDDESCEILSHLCFNFPCPFNTSPPSLSVLYIMVHLDECVDAPVPGYLLILTSANGVTFLISNFMDLFLTPPNRCLCPKYTLTNHTKG